MEPLVSIIVPCFNSENTISRTISSLEQQTYKNIEAVLVDDGSTDGTLSIIEDYASKYKFIKLVKQKNSGKPAIARNKGILESHGDIICFLDADDTYHKDRIYEVVNCFNENNDITVVFHDYCIKLNDSIVDKSVVHKKLPEQVFYDTFDIKCKNKYHFRSKSGLYQKFLSSHLPIHTSSISIKRKIFDDLLFNESYTCYEDLDKWLYYISDDRAVYLDKVLSCYYDTENSVSKNVAIMINDGILFYQRHYNSPLKKLSINNKIQIRNKLSEEYKSLAYYYEKNKQFKLANKNYVHGLYMYPRPLYIYWISKSLARSIIHSIKI